MLRRGEILLVMLAESRGKVGPLLAVVALSFFQSPVACRAAITIRATTAEQLSMNLIEVCFQIFAEIKNDGQDCDHYATDYEAVFDRGRTCGRDPKSFRITHNHLTASGKTDPRVAI